MSKKKDWPSWMIVLNAQLRTPPSYRGHLFHRLHDMRGGTVSPKVLFGGRLVP